MTLFFWLSDSIFGHVTYWRSEAFLAKWRLVRQITHFSRLRWSCSYHMSPAGDVLWRTYFLKIPFFATMIETIRNRVQYSKSINECLKFVFREESYQQLSLRGFRTHHEDHCKKACHSIRNCKCWNYIHRSHGKRSGFCNMVTNRKTIQKIYFHDHLKIISDCKNTKPRRWKSSASILINQCSWRSFTQFFSLRASFSKVFSFYFSFFKSSKILPAEI